MPEVLQQLFFNPAIAVARLGGSTTPMAAYAWAQPENPRADGETIVVPQWTLRVLPDGTVDPSMPIQVEFRDGDLIRPVCPFLELWAHVGEPGSSSETWREVPVTPALLAEENLDTAALRFRVDARNTKAARRMKNPDLAFGTFPAVELLGSQHVPVVLEGRSPPGVAQPMIPASRVVPLGSFQVLRSRPQPTDRLVSPWLDEVNVEVVRVRFTPARGRFYGPPQAAVATTDSQVPSVLATNAFLDPNAGWFNGERSTNSFVVPPNTVDTVAAGATRSLGVIDDTCEVRVEVELTVPASARTLRAHANVFVAPPDYAPDRRPFLSIADEFNDRTGDVAARSGALTGAALDAWVEDLFERVYETTSLLNVDFYRSIRGVRQLPASHQTATIPNDGITPAAQAMGSRDALRDSLQPIAAASENDPLPLSDRARSRHRVLSDIRQLKNLVIQSPARLQQLVRGPFEVEAIESADATTMRMPPFMRQSNALPLTLAAWQYDLLMRWVAEVTNPPPAPPADAGAALLDVAPTRRLSPDAESRRNEVLRRLDAAGL